MFRKLVDVDVREETALHQVDMEAAHVELHALLVPYLIKLLFGQHAHRDRE